MDDRTDETSGDDGSFYTGPRNREDENTDTVFRPVRTVADECRQTQLRQLRGWAVLLISAGLGVVWSPASSDPALGVVFVSAGMLGAVTIIAASLHRRVLLLQHPDLEVPADLVRSENARITAGVWEFSTALIGIGVVLSLTADTAVPWIAAVAVSVALVFWDIRSRKAT